MDVVNVEQVRMPYTLSHRCCNVLIDRFLYSLAAISQKARIAEEAGACAVMALERVPADIRATGGVARMASARFPSPSIMVLDPLPLWFRVIPT